MERSIDYPILRMDEWLECTAVEPEISATFGKLYFAHGNIEFTSHRNGASYCSAAYLPATLWHYGLHNLGGAFSTSSSPTQIHMNGVLPLYAFCRAWFSVA